MTTLTISSDSLVELGGGIGIWWNRIKNASILIENETRVLVLTHINLIQLKFIIINLATYYTLNTKRICKCKMFCYDNDNADDLEWQFFDFNQKRNSYFSLNSHKLDSIKIHYYKFTLRESNCKCFISTFWSYIRWFY